VSRSDLRSFRASRSYFPNGYGGGHGDGGLTIIII
jgi:hypothetical protein